MTDKQPVMASSITISTNIVMECQQPVTAKAVATHLLIRPFANALRIIQEAYVIVAVRSTMGHHVWPVPTVDPMGRAVMGCREAAYVFAKQVFMEVVV